MKIKRGSTSVRRLIFIADSSSTTGAGLANLTHASSGLVAYYFAGDLANEVQVTLVSATLGSYTSGGFVAVDNTNMPGWYEIGIPNAALDGGNEVAIQLRGATNMVPVNIYIEIDSVDYQDAAAFGLSRIDSAVSSRLGAASYTAPPSSATIATDVWAAATRTITGGTITTVSDKTGYSLATTPPTASAIASQVRTELTTELGRIDAAISTRSTFAGGAVASVTAPVTVGTNNDKTGYALSQAFPANFASLGINASGHVSRVVLVDTCTTNSDMRGTNNALLAASYTVPDNASITAIKAKTDNLPSDPADASDIASSFSTVNTKLDAIDDFIDTEVSAIKAKTDNLPANPAKEETVQAVLGSV